LAKTWARRRTQLQTKIDAFLAKTPLALGNLIGADEVPLSWAPQHLDEDGDDDMEDDEDEEDDQESEEDEENSDDYEDEVSSPPGTHGAAESIVLPLPSHLGVNKCQDPHLAPIIADELIIRQSQASDALQQVRLALGMKSALFRKMVSNANSQKKKSRAWWAVTVAAAVVQKHARSYSLAQHALVQLHANHSILTKFPPLETCDLTVSRDVVEENRIGQRNEHVSWIWRLDIGSDQDKNEWIHESE
jgi:hypothetical protein